MEKATNKLHDRVINIAEQTVFVTLEACDADHIKNVFKVALKNALNGLLVSIRDDFSDIKEPFEDAIVQVAMATQSLAIIASAVAKGTATGAPIARYAASTVRRQRINQ